MLLRYLLFFFFACLFSFSSLHSQSVFINEINYAGTSLTDGVGIAGPSNVEINGWSLVFYNEDGTVSHTVLLPTKIIPDSNNSGEGEVWYDVAMLDDTNAFALVNAAGEVIQFLSYGCIQNGDTCENYIVTATQGIAINLTSTSVQTVQSSTEASIQLVGIGMSYLDFIWAYVPIPVSPGQINVGQVFGAPSLAIQLESFNVKTTLRGNQVSWTTSSEVNGDYFILERSLDGIQFEMLQKIDTKNNINQTATYQYLDHTAKRSATSYYRLQQVDIDGTIEWSEIIYTEGINTVMEVQTFPNPTVDNINITLASTTKAIINIINTAGQVVSTIDTETNIDLIKLDVNNLPNGLYFVQVNQDEQIYSSTFIKE